MHDVLTATHGRRGPACDASLCGREICEWRWELEELEKVRSETNRRLKTTLSLSFFFPFAFALPLHQSLLRKVLGRKRAWYLTSSAARGRTAGLGAGAALLSGRFLRGMGPPAEEEAAAAPGLLELELLSAILVRSDA